MCSACVLVGWCRLLYFIVGCLVSRLVSWSVSTYSCSFLPLLATSGRLRVEPSGQSAFLAPTSCVTSRRSSLVSRPWGAQRDRPPGTNWLRDQSGANKTFRHGRCQRAPQVHVPNRVITRCPHLHVTQRDGAGLELLKVTEITALLIALLLLLLYRRS